MTEREGSEKYKSPVNESPSTYLKFIVELKLKRSAGQWWHIPLIPALGEAEASRSEFMANLAYKVSSRMASTTQRNPVSEKIESKINK